MATTVKPLHTHSGEALELTLRDISGADFLQLNKLPIVSQGKSGNLHTKG